MKNRNKKLFAIDIMGNPMREYEPGKWENSIWKSQADKEKKELLEALGNALDIIDELCDQHGVEYSEGDETILMMRHTYRENYEKYDT